MSFSIYFCRATRVCNAYVLLCLADISFFRLSICALVLKI